MIHRIILIGPPGAGKSTIGKTLASELGWIFLDSDREIERKTGRKISEIFVEDGEAKFRQLESAEVLRLLDREFSITPIVLALGGGAILDPIVYDRLLQEPGVIYLEVSISNAAPRVGFNKERPLLLGNPRQQWLSLFAARKSKYEALAKFRFSTDNRKAREVVADIRSALA